MSKVCIDLAHHYYLSKILSDTLFQTPGLVICQFCLEDGPKYAPFDSTWLDKVILLDHFYFGDKLNFAFEHFVTSNVASGQAFGNIRMLLSHRFYFQGSMTCPWDVELGDDGSASENKVTFRGEMVFEVLEQAQTLIDDDSKEAVSTSPQLLQAPEEGSSWNGKSAKVAWSLLSYNNWLNR